MHKTVTKLLTIRMKHWVQKGNELVPLFCKLIIYNTHNWICNSSDMAFLSKRSGHTFIHLSHFLKQFEIFKVGVPNYIYIKWHLKWCVCKPLSHISLSILQDVCSVFKSICGILPLTDILSFDNNICCDWNLEVFQRSIVNWNPFYDIYF